jgi:predicted ATPase/class 3 adenylate cyclase
VGLAPSAGTPAAPILNQQLPTGTVTFLLTDIEGSTRLLEELGDRYAEVLAEHRRVIRDAVEGRGGVEVDTQGDAVFAAFARAGDAAAAAAEAQRALAAGPVRVRMGIHTGEPALTDEGYVGMDVHRAARVAAAGHGGQVVVSETTRALLGRDVELRDLGEHRLKDLAAPLRLHQLGRDEFPRLRSLSQARLPLEREPLVGRKRELSELLRLLRAEHARIVTVTGPGGIGKTSLAISAAAELVEAFQDGVTLVELAAVRDADHVLPAIADALGADGDAAAHIGDHELLLVLDNFEQVVEAAPVIANLLAVCPNLRALVTSREPLRVAAEREFPLRPLAEAPAVELFRRRAEAVLPDFTGDYGHIAEICRRLDSLPLAIELAAARVKVLPPRELLARLDRRLPLLGAARRDLPERQRTLRATIEWSYDLLTAEEQELFVRLGVFAGGFTLDAAETICDATLDTLQGLVEKSLIRRDDERFSMLETIREFAAERLGAVDEVRRRHAEYFIRLAEESEGKHHGPAQEQLRRRFRTEWDNIRAALAWTVERNELELGLRLAGGLTMIWLDRNHAVEGVAWFRTLLERDGSVAPAVRARGLMIASMIAGVLGNYEASRVWGEQALASCRELGDEAGIAWSLTFLAVVPMERGRPKEATPLLEEAEALHRKHGDSVGVRRVLHLQGQVAGTAGDLEGGRRLLRESAELSRSEGDAFSAASSLHSLGDVELEAGDLDAAEEDYRAALELALDSDAHRLVCYSLAGIAAVAAARGEAERAALLWGFVERDEQRLQFSLRGRALYERHVSGLAGVEEGRRLDVDAAVEIAGAAP